MEQVLLISERYLKAFSTIDLNVDTKMIQSTIAFAQDLYLMPILGTDLYNQLLTQVSGSTLSTANDTLLESYIKPCLASYTIYEISDFLVFKFTNKSIEKQKSDTSDPISLQELNHLKGKLLVRSQHFGERLTKFLQGNTTTYPLYLNGNSTIDKYKPFSSNIQSNFYIPNRKGCSWGLGK